MIAYQNLGTNNIDQAKAFYDELLALFQPAQVMDTQRGRAYFFAGGAALIVNTPFDGKPATVGNGSMTALACDSEAMVQEVYERALALGAVSEGEPGDRGGMGCFAYFRDLDGNKLCAAWLNI